MNYKKFALAAAVAGMLVSCGKTPAAPDWSAEVKSFIAENFYNVDFPYFVSQEFGQLEIDCNASYKAILIDGDKELTSSESIKTAADMLADLGFEDVYAPYRGKAEYAQYVSEWVYPMRTRLEVEDLGVRYVTVSLSGQVPEATVTEEGSEPAGTGRYFHCEVFDPYDYTWTDSYSSYYIAFGFGGVDEQGQYFYDEAIYDELVAFTYPATFPQNGGYYSYIQDAIDEVEENGYLIFSMMDVDMTDLASYKDDLVAENWQVFTYEPEEVEEGYLPRLYRYVSPSEYFMIDVYAKDGEVMFQVRLLPEYSEALSKVAELSQTSKYDYSYDEEENVYYSYFDVSEFAGGPTTEEVAALDTAEKAKAAYDLIKNSNATDVYVVDDFETVNNYYGLGTLDVDNHCVYIAADYESSINWSTWTVDYYFYWMVQVSDWPEYPEVINPDFATAAGANNYHQFYEQQDGSFKFGKEVEAFEDVTAVFAALSALDGAEVKREFNGAEGENGYGRIKLGNSLVTLEYEYEAATEASAASQGYYVIVTDYVEPDVAVATVASTLGLDPFSFLVDEASGAFFIQGTEEAEWAETKATVSGMFETLAALPGAESTEPEVRDEDEEYWGSYVGTLLIDGKLIQVSSYRTDSKEVTEGEGEEAVTVEVGLYVYQIVVCDPKEENPEVTAIMQAIATAAGLTVEFSQIDGLYYFSEIYPSEIPGGAETMVAWGEALIAALKEALPDLDIEDVYEDYWGDVYITIHVSESLDVEVFIQDYTSYGFYYIGAESQVPEADAE